MYVLIAQESRIFWGILRWNKNNLHHPVGRRCFNPTEKREHSYYVNLVKSRVIGAFRELLKIVAQDRSKCASNSRWQLRIGRFSTTIQLVKIIRRHAKFDRQPSIVTDMNESRMCEKSLPSPDNCYRAFVCLLGRLFKFYCCPVSQFDTFNIVLDYFRY